MKVQVIVLVCVIFFFGYVSSCTPPTAQERANEESPPEGGAKEEDLRDFPCNKLKEKMQELMQAKEKGECQQNSDCQMYAARGNCSCYQALLGGFAGSKTNPLYQQLHERFFSDECYSIRGCSYHVQSSVPRPSCVEGLCISGFHRCSPPTRP